MSRLRPTALARVATLAAVCCLLPAAPALGTATASAATSSVAGATGQVAAAADDQGDDDVYAGVLARAGVALSGGAATGTAGAGVAQRGDASLLLRDVFTARPDMSLLDDLRADALLARPTDGRQDAYGDGYRTRAQRVCGPHVCVHSVRRGPDAPPGAAWVRQVLDRMEHVWRAEVGRLGYRRPPSDGERGGDGRFDVYLTDLGGQGLFGYCAPEARTSPGARTASSYCVLDDDFARVQYDRAPRQSLDVTTAHEFFHAIQFGYDVHEDPWLLESTATWMEERVADGVDDNRTFLKYGQVRHPERPLDLFATDGYDQYGNWAFWEYLSERDGPGIVHRLWNRLSARPGAPDQTSIGALRSVLADQGGLPRVFARYAAANVDPGDVYDEGAAWPAAGPARRWRLSPSEDRARVTTRLDHLTSHSVALSPADPAGTGGDPARWRLQVRVDGPERATSPAALLVVRTTDGRRRLQPVRLDADGDGKATVSFDSGAVTEVVLTLANASTRYDCNRSNPSYACRGNPLDERRPFTATARLLTGRPA